jgi:hypothetical protein
MTTNLDRVQGLELTNLTGTPASLLEWLRQPFDPDGWTRFVSLGAAANYAITVVSGTFQSYQGCGRLMLQRLLRRGSLTTLSEHYRQTKKETVLTSCHGNGSVFSLRQSRERIRLDDNGIFP